MPSSLMAFLANRLAFSRGDFGLGQRLCVVFVEVDRGLGVMAGSSSEAGISLGSIPVVSRTSVSSLIESTSAAYGSGSIMLRGPIGSMHGKYVFGLPVLLMLYPGSFGAFVSTNLVYVCVEE